MPFRSLALLSAFICAVLCLGLLSAPGLFADIFGLGPSVAGEVMARRAGVLFAPLALILWTIRDLPNETLRREFASAVLVMMAGLAVLGTAEWAAGRVGPGIFLAVGIETVLAVLYALALRRGH